MIIGRKISIASYIKFFPNLDMGLHYNVESLCPNIGQCYNPCHHAPFLGYYKLLSEFYAHLHSPLSNHPMSPSHPSCHELE